VKMFSAARLSAPDKPGLPGPYSVPRQ